MMPHASDALSARAVLEQTFALLLEHCGTTAVDLPARAQAEIADDSFVPHEPAFGYIGYERAALVRIPDGTRWALGNGRKCGQYPGDHYDSDIAACILNGLLDHATIEPAHLGGALALNDHFFHSAIVACRNGSFGVAKDSVFFQSTSAVILPRIGGFVAKAAVIDRTCIDPSTMRARVATPATYRPDIVPFLAEMIVLAIEDEIS